MSLIGRRFLAARLNNRTAQQTRDHIKSSLLIKKLQDHVLNSVEMTPTQLRAAEILLNKTLPNLKQSDDSLLIDGELDINQVKVRYTDEGD